MYILPLSNKKKHYTYPIWQYNASEINVTLYVRATGCHLTGPIALRRNLSTVLPHIHLYSQNNNTYYYWFQLYNITRILHHFLWIFKYPVILQSQLHFIVLTSSRPTDHRSAGLPSKLGIILFLRFFAFISFFFEACRQFLSVMQVRASHRVPHPQNPQSLDHLKSEPPLSLR